MDGTEPAPFVREELPARALMTAQELLNWRAFGLAVDADLSGRADIVQRWGRPPDEDGTTSEVLVALQEMAGICTAPLERALAWRHTPKWLAWARKHAAELVNRHGVPPTQLIQELEHSLARYRSRSDMLRDASRSLIDPLVSGKLTVLATPAEYGAGMARCPVGGSVDVPAAYFGTPELHIHPDGSITIPGGAGYVGARFRTAEVAVVFLVPAVTDSDSDAQPRTDKTSRARATEDACAIWLKEQWPKSRAMKKPDWLPQARSQPGWGALSEAGFNRAWAEASKWHPGMSDVGRPRRSQAAKPKTPR